MPKLRETSKDKPKTRRLVYRKPSFLKGAATITEAGRSEGYVWKVRPAPSSGDGIHSDWRAVGGDLRTAISKYNSQRDKPNIGQSKNGNLVIQSVGGAKLIRTPAGIVTIRSRPSNNSSRMKAGWHDRTG